MCTLHRRDIVDIEKQVAKHQQGMLNFSRSQIPPTLDFTADIMPQYLGFVMFCFLAGGVFLELREFVNVDLVLPGLYIHTKPA